MTLLTAPARAQERGPLVMTGPAETEILSQHFEYTTDPEWQMSVEDLIDPQGVEMQPLPGPVPDFGYTAARIWLRAHLVNGTASETAWRFFAQANFTQKIAVYLVGADGAVETLLDLTEDSPFSARPIDDPQMVAPFTLAPGEAATLIVAYYSQGSSRISMSVETVDSFAAQARVRDAKSYAFYGMMVVIIVLAAVALAVLREPVFAAYAGYLTAILVYVMHGEGAAFQFLWPDFPRFNSMASVVAGSAVMVFGSLFAITFLQTARYQPVMHRILLTIIVGVLAIDVVLWVVDPQLLKQLLVIMISVSVLTFVAAGLLAARTRFREVRFYVFSWTASLIPALLFTARFGLGLEQTFVTPYDTIRLALIVDALMMGLAIFDRYNHLRRSAMEETLAQARRNLALSQRLASLEDSYDEVTALARQREESVKDTVHDLRQPMHALRLSLRQMFKAEGGKTDAGQVESALAYMEQLVAERLAATSVASPTANEPGLHAVLRGVADMFAPEAAERGLGLKLVLAAPDASVDAYALMRVTANLVSNAIKYTREGRVLIALRRNGPGYRVEVHDTGPGLQGVAFEQALVRNERLERDRSVAEGSGLGLAVARQIAHDNGWTITSCERRRTGASIRIELPGAGAGPVGETDRDAQPAAPAM